MAQVDQRIRPTLCIERGAPDALKAKVFVETTGRHVLFIHIRCQVQVKVQSVLHKCPADAGTSMNRIDEQGLHVAIAQQHETDCAVVFVCSQPEGRVRQKRYDFQFDIVPVLRREKVMGCIDGAPPYLQHPLTIRGCGGSEVDHGSEAINHRHKEEGAQHTLRPF